MKIKPLIVIVISAIILTSCASPSPEQIRESAWFLFIVGVIAFLFAYNGTLFYGEFGWQVSLYIALVFISVTTVSLLSKSATDLLFLYIVIVVVNFLISFLVISFSRQPQSLKDGFLLENDGYKWQTHIINYFRVRKNQLPIWLLPSKESVSSDELKLLEKTNLLYYEVANSIKRCNLSTDVKNSLLNQSYLVPLNIVNGIWKLANLRKLMSVTYGMDTAKNHNDENKILQSQVTQEMNSLIEKLTSLSMFLLKFEITRDNTAIERILLELSDGNSKLQNITTLNGVNYNKININGNVFGSTIIIGNENKVQNSQKKK